MARKEKNDTRPYLLDVPVDMVSYYKCTEFDAAYVHIGPLCKGGYFDISVWGLHSWRRSYRCEEGHTGILYKRLVYQQLHV